MASFIANMDPFFLLIFCSKFRQNHSKFAFYNSNQMDQIDIFGIVQFKELANLRKNEIIQKCLVGNTWMNVCNGLDSQFR